MLRGRILIAAAIILFWLVMTGLLVRREVLIPRAEQAARGMGEYDTWMGIYLPRDDGSNEKIGFVHSAAQRTTRDDQTGLLYSLLFKMRVSLLNQLSDLRVDGEAWIPDTGSLSEFWFKVASGDEHAMTIDGLVHEERVQLEVNTGNDTFPLTLPLGKDFLVAGPMGAATLNVPALEVGEEAVIESFDPMTMSMGRARIKCLSRGVFPYENEEVPVLKLSVTIGGLESETWITEKEEVVYVKTPLGMVLRKEPALRAVDLEGAASGSGLITRVAVKPTGKRPFTGARRMVFTVSGVPNDIRPPSDAIQTRIEDATYRIEVPASHDTGPEEPLNNPAPYLDGDALVQVGHPAVEAALAEIVDGDEAPWPLALQLYEWVYENIDKTIVLSFPSAIEVLQTREGDCNEHTVLYTALARTAGLPTKIAIGVVWSEALGGFYYHAWPEVYVGRWIAMDPTLGQPIADATHIKLIEGSIDQWPRLVPYLGQLQVEIIEVE